MSYHSQTDLGSNAAITTYHLCYYLTSQIPFLVRVDNDIYPIALL